MISWMQKHNKYLIITIWIATIAFIGAGFVGWGSYQYGSKAGAIGKVGDVEITQEKFDMTYQNLYNQYNDIFKGQFDESRAKEMNLASQAFSSITSQAQLINLAKKYGIVVSDAELGEYVTSIQGFQNNGVFSKIIYDTYLKSRGLRAKSFEAILKDELIVKRLMDMFHSKAQPFEVDILISALSIADKVAYKVVKSTDIVVIKLPEEELKNYWQMFKSSYMTPRRYTLDIVWTDSSIADATEKELHGFYDKNSYNYVDATGKILDYDRVKQAVEKDYKLKKSKKQALKDYIAFKKDELKKSETKELSENSTDLSPELWEAIKNSKPNEIIKPKAVGQKYATVKLINTVASKEMSFKDARDTVMRELVFQKKSEMMEKKSQEILKNIDNEELNTTGWMTMNKFDNMQPLDKQETLQFLQKLFASSTKNGIITVSNSVVVYKILEQKMDNVDSNLSNQVGENVSQLKSSIFKANLFKTLNNQYPVQRFVKRNLN